MEFTKWLNERQVAAITGLSVHTLRSHRLKRKGLPYSKVGRAVRYNSEEVQAYMNARRVNLEW